MCVRERGYYNMRNGNNQHTHSEHLITQPEQLSHAIPPRRVAFPRAAGGIPLLPLCVCWLLQVNPPVLILITRRFGPKGISRSSPRYRRRCCCCGTQKVHFTTKKREYWVTSFIVSADTHSTGRHGTSQDQTAIDATFAKYMIYYVEWLVRKAILL